MRENPRRWLGRLGLGVAHLAVLACLAAPAGAKDEATLPPRPEDLLRQMSALLEATKAFSFHAEINYDDLVRDEFMVQYAGALDVSVRRPDRLRVDYRDDLSAKRLWYRRDTMTLLDRGHNVYSVAKVPSQLDPALDEFAQKYGVSVPLGDLLFEDPDEVLLADLRQAMWVGLNDVDGDPCHHLVFLKENVDVQLWLEPGERRLPRKLVVTYKNLPGAPQYVANLMDWDLSPKLPESDFTPVTADATKVDFLEIEEARR